MRQNELFFVTRMKKSTQFKLVERNKTDSQSGATSDHVIEIGSGNKLRREGLVIMTLKHISITYFGPTILLWPRKFLRIYTRPDGRLNFLFNEIKRFLKIKKFVGTNENAVKIQLYTALTVYLLLALQKFLSKIRFSLDSFFN